MLFKRYHNQYKENLRLAIPVVLSQLGYISVQLADYIMVGKLGSTPFAAVSFGGTVFFMVFIFLTGLSTGLTPVVGEQYSQGHYRKAAAFFQNSLVAYPLVGLIAFGLLYALTPVLNHMRQPAEVVAEALPYYKYMTWSVLPFMVFASMKQFLEGIGNTKANMIIIITSNVLNIVLNYLLIYGKFGFPEMGSAGAGLATLISRIVMPLLALVYFYAVPRFRRYFRYFREENFSWQWNKPLLRVGFPIGMQMFLEGAAFAVTPIMMGWFGTFEIAGNQAALTISTCAFMIVQGIGAATTIRVSHEYGRGNFRQVKLAANASLHLVLVWNAISAIIIISFRKYLPLLFNSEPEVVAVASHLLLFVAAFQFSDGIQCIGVSILRGIQDVKPIMFIAFLAYTVINIPVALFCAFVLKMGPGGIWVGLIMGLSIAATLLLRRFYSRYKYLRRGNIGARDL